MVFGTLVGMFVFSVIWSELLMTCAISCPLWSSVYECHKVECAFTSLVRTECGMLCVFMVEGMSAVVNVYGRRYVCCGECYVVSNECDEPTPPPPLCNLLLRTVVKLCTLGVLTLG